MPASNIAQTAASPAFRQYLVDLLVEIVKIDTTPRPDVALSQKNESQVFSILEREFNRYGFAAASTERPAINPAIGKHPFFSNLYYSMSKENPKGLSVEKCYQGRTNLLLKIDGEQKSATGVNQAIDVHIDVIAPFFPPRVESDRVYGRGACDDKGNAVALMGALRLVGEHLKKSGKRLNKHLTGLIVIEEETGGNGSLSFALDRNLKKRYDSLVVLEICESRLFPGNRGAVWYKLEGKLPGANLFEAAAFIVEEMEKEGRSIKSESDHQLFPHRPVQTCHGMMGGSGEHPSRINGWIDFEVHLSKAGAQKARKLILDVTNFAIEEYVGRYGDKTKANDARTGKPKVDHHVDVVEAPHGFTIQVHGSTGHMGSILENDGAITKMAQIVRGLVRSRGAIETASGGKMELRQVNWPDTSHLVMEGGQGFLPTHPIDQVQQRMREAVWRGADNYFRHAGVNGKGADIFKVTYEKLHNAAFAGAPDSPDMLNAIESAKQAGIWKNEPIRGWDVSCDSRIFASEYPGMPVITTGPGSLNSAHSDTEHIEVTEMVKFAEFLAYYILRQTGTEG